MNAKVKYEAYRRAVPAWWPADIRGIPARPTNPPATNGDRGHGELLDYLPIAAAAFATTQFLELVPAAVAWLAATVAHRGRCPSPGRDRARAAAGAVAPIPREVRGAYSPRTSLVVHPS